MFRKIEKFSHSTKEIYAQKHRFEHWYVDNQVYFITARCRDRFLAFASEEAKRIFWDRYYYYCKQYNIFPWVTSLLDNHYHSLAYVRYGEDLKRFMQRLHGSVAKLVNDLLVFKESALFRFVLLALHPFSQILARGAEMERLANGVLVHLRDDFAAMTFG